VTNTLYALKAKDGFADHDAWQTALDSLVAMVAPFAPHIADELWQQLGHDTTVQRDSWPLLDEKYLVQDTVTLAVQVNGKLRGTVDVAADADESTSVETAKQSEKVAAYLEGKTIVKTIYVPKKLISFVVK
jgi:leucyl-tRNA synthetase